MKHLLNNLSEEEKNSIREQHEGGMKLDTSRFRTLLESKSGNVKPLVEQDGPSTEDMPLDPIKDGLEEMVGVDYMSDELEEDFEGEEKPLNIIQKHLLKKFRSNPNIASDYGMSDEEFNDFVYNELDHENYNDMFYPDDSRFVDDEEEEEDLGFAQHDGDFGGDDSEFDDEEELDLTEFDDLEDDEDTW